MQSIYVISPSKNILKLLADNLITKKHFSSLIIFPHRRPAIYLKYYLMQKLNKNFISPQITSFEDWVSELFVNMEQHPRPCLSEYDQAWLIYKTAQKILPDKELVSSWDDFFPWALKIVNLFKEFDLELACPKNLYNPPTEEELPVQAAQLLKHIGQLYANFNQTLEENNYTTLGKRIRFLAENDFPLPEVPVYLVGFYALTKAEDRIFKKLHENGAHIYWHADKDNLPELYRRWQKQWNVPLISIGQPPQKPKLYFFEAHDLHSELKELQQKLPSKITDPAPDKHAIVLLSPTSLIPLTYHLPDGPINLTMGYPLNLTGIYNFFTALFELILNKDNNSYPLKNFIEFLKTPYLEKKLHFNQDNLQFASPFLSQKEILDIFENKTYLSNLFEHVINPIEKANTTYNLAKALKKVFFFLNPETNFTSFEKEFLKTILENVFPVLENSLFANIPMSMNTLFNFFEQLISSIRIPFEGEPLAGLQVMGPLETRLLSFSEIFFLDLNEGIMPSVEEVNPLIPHGLRQAIGLPEKERQEAILRYHFERFFLTAKKVHLFWQFSTTGGDSSLENKKIRSRYIEKLIWEIEVQKNKILSPDQEHNFKKSTFNISLDNFFNSNFIKKNQALKEKIKTKLQTISPSLLEQYLKCPLNFYYQYLAELKKNDLPPEVDFGQIGTAVHKTLQKFIAQIAKNKFPATIKKQDLDLNTLIQYFEEELNNSPLLKSFSQERKFLLRKGAEHRFSKYIKHQPEQTNVICLEKKLNSTLTMPELGEVTLSGRIDRIDLRNEVFIILDYKTGWVPEFSISKLQKISPQKWLNQNQYNEDTFLQLTELEDIQLLFYIYLFIQNNQSKQSDLWSKTTAAYINLRDDGQEKYLIKPQHISSNYSEWIKEELEYLLKYIILHIIYSDYIYPTPNKVHCQYCEFKLFCKYGEI
ncbi:MAG: PD-(D/E)XK nuclease family protein [Desulfonauticus sp.]|nr:PD-(D/E)XK nuclease family protein [Desulfonauticus sp.]